MKHGSYGYRKDEIGKRLRRIEGQIRGIQRMVDEEQYCVDILTQISAIQAALEKVSIEVLRDHVNGCVRDSAVKGDATPHLEELVTVIERFAALKH